MKPLANCSSKTPLQFMNDDLGITNKPVITLLSDFGTKDWFVAVMKSVILELKLSSNTFIPLFPSSNDTL